MFSLNETMINSLLAQKDWWSDSCSSPILPGLLKANLKVDGPPKDTFIQLPDWDKGIIIVNGFNIGRYRNMKPQSSYYVPAPLLRTGSNTVLIFEEKKRGSKAISTDKHLVGQVQK